MHTVLETKLAEAFLKGVKKEGKELPVTLTGAFRHGLNESEVSKNVIYVEDIRGLVTLAYGMGRDVTDEQDASRLGGELATLVAASAITHDEWRRRYILRRKVAETIQLRCEARARKLCKEAGLDPTLLGIHPHNATASRDAGQPWSGIDYAKVDACMDELRHAYDFFRDNLESWHQEVRGNIDTDIFLGL